MLGDSVRLSALTLLSTSVLQLGCATLPSVVRAPYLDSGITLDGHLLEAIWKKAPAYPMRLPIDRLHEGKRMEEGGEVRFAWDDRYFYLGVRFEDSDIVAEGTADNQQHNNLGDTCELLIKPDDHTWYWELHVTPGGKKASFLFAGRGTLVLPSSLQYRCDLKVAAHCEGTLNDWIDQDKGWTAELAMPIEALTARGEQFGPAVQWRVLVGRYNYSRFLSTRGPELTTAPRSSKTDFHRFEEYPMLKLLR